MVIFFALFPLSPLYLVFLDIDISLIYTGTLLFCSAVIPTCIHTNIFTSMHIYNIYAYIHRYFFLIEIAEGGVR